MIPWKMYRQKPVMIDAFRFSRSILTTMTVAALDDMCIVAHMRPVDEDDYLVIAGDKGDVVATEGDWVIIDADDQISICTDKKFRETYQGAWPP